MNTLIDSVLSNNQPLNFALTHYPFQIIYSIWYHEISKTQTCYLLLMLKTSVFDTDLINRTQRFSIIKYPSCKLFSHTLSLSNTLFDMVSWNIQNPDLLPAANAEDLCIWYGFDKQNSAIQYYQITSMYNFFLTHYLFKYFIPYDIMKYPKPRLATCC